jgi:hypothetical protein
MFQEAKETIPPEIAIRLNNLGKANEESIHTLLHDARFHLGWPREFDEDRDLDICMRAVFNGLEPGATSMDRSCYIRPEDTTPRRLVPQSRSGQSLKLEISYLARTLDF